MGAIELATTARGLSFLAGGVEIARYVDHPQDAPLESPRPYFHPLRTLEGREVTLARPHDHVWHKGLAPSWPNVGPHNFWGGVTYVRDQGYVQLDNNGAIQHRGYRELIDDDRDAGFVEDLAWIAADGTLVAREERIALLDLLPGDGWALDLTTRVTNATDQSLAMGSPTTEGRPDAGYGGIFWRGPRSFTGGRVLVDGREVEEPMGREADWVSFTGRHDGETASSTVVLTDLTDPARRRGGRQWFVRRDPYAVIAASPFYDDVVDLEPGGSFDLRVRLAILDGEPDADALARIALAPPRRDPSAVR